MRIGLTKLRRMLNKAAGKSVNTTVMIVDDAAQQELAILRIDYVAEKGAIVILVGRENE